MPQERAVYSEQNPPSRRPGPGPGPGPGPAPKPAAPQAESFSFQDLMKDLEPMPPAGGTSFQDLGGPAAAPAAPRDLDDPRNDRNRGAHGLDDIPDPDIEKKLQQMLGEDKTNARMLTGSATKGNPMWISGAFLGTLSWGMCYFLALGPAFQPIGTYASLVISAGGIVWGISALRNESDTPTERKLGLIGLALSASAGAVAAFSHFGG